MSDDKQLDNFTLQFRAEVVERAHGVADRQRGDSDSDFKENAFTQLYIDYLTEIGEIDDGEICFSFIETTKGSIKTNGYYIDEETGRLDLFVSICENSRQTNQVSREELVKNAKRAERLVKFAIKGDFTQIEPASDQFSMFQQINSTCSTFSQIRIVLLIDGNATISDINLNSDLPCQVKVVVWDFRRLFRNTVDPHSQIIIEFNDDRKKSIPCLIAPTESTEYRAFMAVIPGDELANVYEEYGTRLLDLNVRSFLQVKGKVNSKIRETLRSVPQRFLAYNNGISAVVEDIETHEFEDGRYVKRLVGLQVVNGGQTMASIHRAKYLDKASLANVFVPAKICVIGENNRDEVVHHISLYANSQNKISESDFSANSPYHIRVQHLSEKTWNPGERSRWFYERARGQYQVAKQKQGSTPAQLRKFEETYPTNQKITKTDLAKFINSWNQRPHIVSRGQQANFVSFMDDLKSKLSAEWLPDEAYYKELIGKAILFRAVKRLVKDNSFPAYGANLVTYLIAYTSYRTSGLINFISVWEKQEISKGLQEALQSWCQDVYDRIVESAAGRNVTQWCKREDCWKAVKSLNLIVPESLRTEIESGNLSLGTGSETETASDSSSVLSFEDQENIVKVMSISAEVWSKIIKWGRETKNLFPKQCAIAESLSLYALQGWAKKPSPPQAKSGMKILKKVEENTDFLHSLDG